MLFYNRGIESVILSKKGHRKTNLFTIDQLDKIENDINVVIVGLLDNYKEQINIILPSVKFIDNNFDFDPKLLNDANLILISKMNHNYALSYKVECMAYKKKIPVGNLLFDEDNKYISHISETAMYSI